MLITTYLRYIYMNCDIFRALYNADGDFLIGKLIFITKIVFIK